MCPSSYNLSTSVANKKQTTSKSYPKNLLSYPFSWKLSNLV